MKKIIVIASIFISSISIVGCSEEGDTAMAPFVPVLYKETFPEANIDYNQTFDFQGWTNFAEAGTKLWIERDFQNDGYIQFSSFGSGQASNIGWAITPQIKIQGAQNPVLEFRSATNFVDNPNNKLEVFISTNYNGINVLSATWTPLSATVANELTNNYTYIPSGAISLSAYNGQNVHIAFKVTGNGTTLDGLFQVDDVKVYDKQ